MTNWFVLAGLFLCFEAANFTGFSWSHLRRLSDDELISIAVRFKYPLVYKTIEEFRADYSKFKPEVFYWEDFTDDQPNQFWSKFFGHNLFNVRLPDAVVIVDVDGHPWFSRSCNKNSWCSPTFPPDGPVLGIVGTVQEGSPYYDAAVEFTANWINDPKGTSFISGHCFSALSRPERPTLKIGSSRRTTVTFDDMYGYYLVAINDVNNGARGQIRISEEDFKRYQSCDKAIRAKWPNVGGVSWKR